MYFEEHIFKVRFENSQETIQVGLKALGNRVIGFLRCCDTRTLGSEFALLLDIADAEIRFLEMLKMTGFEANSKAFFEALLDLLRKTNNRELIPIELNGYKLPYLMLVDLFELLIPGHKLHSIESVEELERVTNVRITSRQERVNLQKVIERYPVRLSPHVVRQIRLSHPVAYQYIPFQEELDPEGQENTWIGQYHNGLLERMYNNRVIFVLNMECPVYCRFCFRKHKECRSQRPPGVDDVQEALVYLKTATNVKEVVLTGGDPFMNRQTMTRAIDGLKMIPHIQTLRLATRSIAYYPDLFLKNGKAWMNYLTSKNLMLRKRGKRLEIATHFIHPDEVTWKSLDIISTLTKSGIKVYVQTPFLKDCNDKGEELVKLYDAMRGAGAEIHYIYIPCSPIQGNSVYWTPISDGVNIAKYLRANLSDRAIPKICTATPMGKIDWQTSGWAVEEADDPGMIWLRTPYTREYIEAFAPVGDSKHFRKNIEGTFDIKFQAKIGDKRLFRGARESAVQSALFSWSELKEMLDTFKALALSDQRLPDSIVSTGSKSLYRKHKTVIEMDVGIEHEEILKNMQYIQKHKEISDVILSAKLDAVDVIPSVARVIYYLRGIEHVNAIRLRSNKFITNPETYSEVVIDKLGSLNHLAIINPQRLEIETQVCHSTQITDQHRDLIVMMHEIGLSVYVNTPTLAGVNDSKEEMQKISYACRTTGLEFHHIYVAGLPIQKDWAKKYPTNLSIVIDIASCVRREGSGRELPMYIVLTELGEVDFNLTSEVIRQGDELAFRCLPYNLEYFKAMDVNYEWPAAITIDKDGTPISPAPNTSIQGDWLLKK